MNSFDTPWDFARKQVFPNVEIAYHNIVEVCQGGPIIGKISINGEMLFDYFGGPLIFSDNCIYVPIVKQFFGTSFKIAKININTLDINIIGDRRNLIFLDHVESNRIYFYDDINKTQLSFFEQEK